MARTPPGYYLHLIAWAQIGLLIRVYLAELLGSACPSVSWAPCLTSSGSRWGGAFFTDLPANILGSFLMGLFVSSDVLSNSLKHNLTVEAPLAMLPVRSPLQEHVAFQVGLRTGLCGSLTTFASWLTQMVLMIVGGQHTAVLHHTQWVEALGGLVVGTLAATAALVTGQHCALLLYHKLNPGAFIPYGSPAPEQNKLEESVRNNNGSYLQQQQQEQEGSLIGYVQQQEGLSGTEGAGFTSRGSVRVIREGSASGPGWMRTVSSTREGSLTTVVVVQAEGGTDSLQRQWSQSSPSAAAAGGGGGQRLSSLTFFDQRQDVGALELAAIQQGSRTSSIQQQQPQQQQHQQHQQDSVPGFAAGGVGGAAAAAAGGGVDRVSYVDEVDEEEAPAVSVQQVLVDGFAVLAMAVLTGVSLWCIIQGSTTFLPGRDAPFSQEWFWWSIVFGPLGCYARYYLSRFNGKLHGSWKWFPIGTFAANMAACVIDYVMKVVPVRHPLDSVSTAVLAGVVGGVGGCLSTVSTWVVEIQRLMLSFPKTSHGYQYIFISVGTALALGLVVYGIPVWTQ